MSNSVLRLATEYRNAGISVIPIRLDGSKAPASNVLPQVCKVSDGNTPKNAAGSGTWDPYRDRLATDDELERWFADHRCGIGMVTGYISGGLEVLDFDDGDLFEPWRQLVPKIVELLPVIETPSAGWHVLYRCDEIGGNIKIAKDPQKVDKRTLIETRGEGGYIVAEGSPCQAHSTGLPYVQYSGPYLPTIPKITPAQRTELWRAARTFDKQPEIVRDRIRQKALHQYLPRGDVHPVVAAFNEKMTWADILTPRGWATIDGHTWARPGKATWVKSAGINIASDGSEILTVFSGNAGALAPVSGDYRHWNKFNAWAELHFPGNRKEAIRAAAREVAA